MSHPAGDNCWSSIGVAGDRSCAQLETHIHCRNCPVYSERAVQLLDADAAPEYLAEQARRIARPKDVVRDSTKSVLIFRLGQEWLALPTGIFSEVAPLRRVHSLPHRRNAVVLGVANIRGELLVCVSLAAVLGLTTGAAAGAGGRLAVIERGGERFVFPADEISALQRYDDAALTAAPATLAHAQASYTRGMLAWENRTVGVLDPDPLFRTLNDSLA